MLPAEERLEPKDEVLADEMGRVGETAEGLKEAASVAGMGERESRQQGGAASQNGYSYQTDGEMSMELFGVTADGSGLWRVDESSSGGNGRPVSSKSSEKSEQHEPSDVKRDEEMDTRQAGGTEESSDEEGVFQGDMCTSTTGVVRLQSRRKAEMYLVRTDGFTCTREKVRESTLAFTHPSTQQQMLMWKTPPKTVMLLKKLGEDLMKETEEVGPPRTAAPQPNWLARMQCVCVQLCVDV